MIKIMARPNFIKITLNILARIRAKEFSSQQFNLQKMQQVYYNTLAVSAVNQYIQNIGWQTSLENSDSWNPEMHMLLNTADLELSEYGKLECRYVPPQASVMTIPEEVNGDRIAYIAVAIERSHKAAYLLGFATRAVDTISLESLQPMIDLPEYLEQYALSLYAKQSPLPKLTNWLSGAIETGWQTIENFKDARFNISDRKDLAGLQFRTGTISRVAWRKQRETTLIAGVSRVKLWNLGDNNLKIALIICVSAAEDRILDISIKVCPTDNQIHLPEELAIKILDETQQPILQAQTKSDNQNIEFFLSGKVGECFSIQAIFNGVKQTESFII